MNNQIVDFIGGHTGTWKVVHIHAVVGDGLPDVAYLEIAPASLSPAHGGVWCLKGFRSNLRYTDRSSKDQLDAHASSPGRPEATCAALIPIRKSAAWWQLAQDERHAIFETRSGHTGIGLQYIPAVFRRLYHSRDLGEPFDFLTWFEYAPADADAFEALVATLRATPEWGYVEREIDIRLTKS